MLRGIRGKISAYFHQMKEGREAKEPQDSKTRWKVANFVLTPFRALTNVVSSLRLSKPVTVKEP